ncbi:MAG: hypothetical protein MUF61_00140 [archaeon]|jgi:hypothetical protein|nr:hypothetical protein [archaeon]
MKKEDVALIAKSLTSIKNAIDELDSAIKKNDATRANSAKERILEMQIQINRLL